MRRLPRGRRQGRAAAYFPPLPGAAVTQSTDPTTVIRFILSGTQTVATDARPTPLSMPSFGWKLNDAQVAAVATYVRNSWGNAAPAVSAADVANLRRKVGQDAGPEALGAAFRRARLSAAEFVCETRRAWT